MTDACTSRTWAEIDLDAMRHNLQIARSTGKKVMCVIKGNAHGHGAVVCGRALQACGADAFAVACLEEAVALRKGGIQKPILILGYTDPQFFEDLFRYELTQSVCGLEYAQALNHALEARGETASVHIQIDTGMSRLGLFAQGPDSWPSCAADAKKIFSLPALRVTGMYTHFAAADVPEENAYTDWQIENFKGVIGLLQEEIAQYHPVLHLSNSAGVLFHREAWFDMVRAGVMLYGFHPQNTVNGDPRLAPALTLKSHVVQVKELPAGCFVSYGKTYRTDAPTKIAVVAAGYADSYPRSLSNRGAYAVINGRKCTQIGRICMDLCMFDVTGVDTRAGDEVILYGRGGMSLEEVTNLIGTINCEVTCMLTDRVHRVYLHE
ncbi:MAG: alanine racemase [Oscillibacter sp.]|jgi:alanine racemase|nr:alanine racemase [Oscillibacter sp.]